VSTQISLEQSAPAGLPWLKGLGTAIVDLLFPPRCAACHRLGSWFCSTCLDTIEVIRPPVCRCCGLPFGQSAQPASALICPRCRATPHVFDGLVAYAFHNGTLRQAIHAFKYEDLRTLTRPLGQLTAKGWRALRPEGLEIDAVVPVPLHAARQRQRGFNQAALLAREVGADLQLPVVETMLVRVKATSRQTRLNAEERKANVQDAFQCVDASLSGKTVLLIDDVCTTGSTLDAACIALRNAGTSVVWACTLARAR